MATKDPQSAAHGRCPVCGKSAAMAVRPFCSARCRDVDLARWLGGGYAIAGGQVDADEDGDDAASLRSGSEDPHEDDDSAR
jgi:endogenous inhibitor of DNA gyrase (YacG/DUF329 family)